MTPPPRRAFRRRTLLAASIGLAVIVTVGILLYRTQPSSPQIVIPLAGIDTVEGIAVDRSGTLYIVDSGHDRIISRTKDSGVQREWHVAGDPYLRGLAVAPDGSAVYVADYIDEKLFQAQAGQPIPTPVPFRRPIATPAGIALDPAGDLLYTNGYGHHIDMTVPGSGKSSELPFQGLADAEGVAVDTAGNVFVADSGHNRVLELPAGSQHQIQLPFTGLQQPWGVAVDRAGNVYVSDRRNNRVLELAAGSSRPKVLPFAGLYYPSDLAVDGAGNLYVSDWENNRVLEVPAR